MAHRLCALTPARLRLPVCVQWGERRTERDVKTPVWKALKDSLYVDGSVRMTGPRAHVTNGGKGLATAIESLVTENFNTMTPQSESS